MTNILDLFARILISTLFLINGIFKITNYDGTVGWMEGYGVPGILIIPAIIIEILGPILIIVGYQTKITAAFLSLFCLATAIIFHNDFSNQMQLTSFLKNIALAGGFLFLVVNGSKKFPGLSVYSSSKAAVIALTEVLAEEFPNGPSFNVLALGAVQTKMLKKAFPEYVAQTNPNEMASYILDFALNGGKLFNGKLISVSNSTP